MDASVSWNGHLKFTGTADSGFPVPLDTTSALGGDDSAVQPMELIALGLAGCTAMDVISILQKKQQVVTDFEVKIHADRAREHPRVFTRAVIEFLVTGRGVDEAAVVRAIELSSNKYCPAHAMLSRVFLIETRYRIFEEEGRRLVNEGVYIPETKA